MAELAASSEELKRLDPDAVFAFGALSWFVDPVALDHLGTELPRAACVGCSTAGEISDVSVDDGTLCVLAMAFDDPGSSARMVSVQIEKAQDSESGGASLAAQLSSEGLVHVFVLAPGTDLNGSGLIRGLRSVLPRTCTLSGGLAGDAGAFSRTHQWNKSGVDSRKAVAIGFYGPRVEVRCASFGGWKPFGPSRKATKVNGNWLMELDGAPALAVYKRYLGDQAADLPGSGLLFPFEMRTPANERTGLIRTILAVDEDSGGLMMAGEVELGGFLTLMYASSDGIALGAESAARCLGSLPKDPFALLAISCIGRKLVMGARAEEEVEALRSVVGAKASIAGFYSNGEISGDTLAACSLHNQTMTLTQVAENIDY